MSNGRPAFAPFSEARVESMRFHSIEDAMSFLAVSGFSFVGAPNRWKRVSSNEVAYAFVTETDAGAVVTIIGCDGATPAH